MCGIAGTLTNPSRPPNVAAMQAMTAAIHSRGPDAHGIFRDDEETNGSNPD